MSEAFWADGLLADWQLREQLDELGVLASPRADPMTAFGEVVANAVLDERAADDPLTALVRAHGARSDSFARTGAPVGVSPAVADLGIAWTTVAESLAIPDVAAAFPSRRDAACARVRVQTRHSPEFPEHHDLDAIRYEHVIGPARGLVDLFVLLLLSRGDENGDDLRPSNFVWTCVVLSQDCMVGLAAGGGRRLGWVEVHSWWPHALPAGTWDLTDRARALPVPGF